MKTLKVKSIFFSIGSMLTTRGQLTIVSLFLAIVFTISCTKENVSLEQNANIAYDSAIILGNLSKTFTIEDGTFLFDSFEKLDEFQSLLLELEEKERYEYLSGFHFDYGFTPKYLSFLEEKYRYFGKDRDDISLNGLNFLMIEDNNSILPKDNNEFYTVLNDNNIFKVGGYFFGINNTGKLYASFNRNDLLNALKSNEVTSTVFDTHYEVISYENDNISSRNSTCWSESETVVIGGIIIYCPTRVCGNCSVYVPGCFQNRGCWEDIPCGAEIITQDFMASTITSNWEVPIYTYDGDNEPEPSEFDPWNEEHEEEYRNYRSYSRISHSFTSSLPNANLNSSVSYFYNGANYTLTGTGSSSVYLGKTYTGDINVSVPPIIHNSSFCNGTAANGAQVNLSYP